MLAEKLIWNLRQKCLNSKNCGFFLKRCLLENWCDCSVLTSIFDMIRYDIIWYDMLRWYDTIWYDICYYMILFAQNRGRKAKLQCTIWEKNKQRNKQTYSKTGNMQCQKYSNRQRNKAQLGSTVVNEKQDLQLWELAFRPVPHSMKLDHLHILNNINHEHK